MISCNRVKVRPLRSVPITCSPWMNIFLLGLLSMWTPSVYAAMANTNSTLPAISNIGFMKDPPKEWRKQYPMCDAFLRVTWLNKDKRIGYSTFSYFTDGIRHGKMTALVYIGPSYASFDMDLYKYRHDGSLSDIISFIRRGKIVHSESSLALIIRRGSREIAFFPAKSDLSLAKFSRNVCIPYPDGSRMWLAEGRKVDETYSANIKMEKYEILKKYFPHLLPTMFDQWDVVDLNHDGLDDYFYAGHPIYSTGNQYYEMKKLHGNWPAETYKFPPTNMTCELTYGAHYLTTDGKSYFLGNQCNLTELTRVTK